MNSKVRLVFQGLILVLIIWVIITAGDLETYCPMGGILAFGTKLHQGTLPCNMSSIAVFMALALFIGALAIGKLFCSFICPIGFLTEWIGKIGKKFKIQFRLPKLADRGLRSIKYLLLFFVLYFTITSSELFCRKFDPYFGAGTGFGSDTVLLWSLGAVLVTFIGAIFIKQLWCRYFCFLGAASNIFVNLWGAILVAIVYFGLSFVGVKLSLIWLIGGIVFVGFLVETGLFKSLVLPFMKITVDQNACTQCGLCTIACPQDIRVQDFKKVDHPDCVMCTECIAACKEEKAVGINGSFKLRFLPHILVVALISMGFILSSNYEFTTLEKRWGKFEQLETPAIYQQTDLKTVKCWGSAMSLATSLQNKKGIYGVDAYAKSHTVTIYYDSTEISSDEVKQSLFTPSRYKTRTFRDYTPDTLTIWEIGINNLFDRVDQTNLVRALHQSNYIFGVETFFGEPVRTRIFYDADSLDPAEIKPIIEVRKIETEIAGKKRIYNLDFKCEGKGEITGTVAVLDFQRNMFTRMDQKFNDYQEWEQSKLSIYEIGLPNADNIFMRGRMKFLISHISADDHIMRFRTLFTDRPVAQIFFHPEFVDTTKIHQMLMAETLTYFTSDTTTATTPNIFEFEYPARIVSADDDAVVEK